MWKLVTPAAAAGRIKPVGGPDPIRVRVVAVGWDTILAVWTGINWKLITEHWMRQRNFTCFRCRRCCAARGWSGSGYDGSRGCGDQFRGGCRPKSTGVRRGIRLLLRRRTHRRRHLCSHVFFLFTVGNCPRRIADFYSVELANDPQSCPETACFQFQTAWPTKNQELHTSLHTSASFPSSFLQTGGVQIRFRMEGARKSCAKITQRLDAWLIHGHPCIMYII